VFQQTALLKNCFAIVFRGKKTIICGATTAEEKEVWINDIKTNIERFHNTAEARTEEMQKPGTIGIMPGRSPSPHPSSFSVSSAEVESKSETNSRSTTPIHSSSSSSASTSLPATSSSSSGSLVETAPRKLKVYLNHKLADQRVRIVSLPSGLADVENISKIVVKEFEWKDEKRLVLAYLDEDGDFVEFSPSTLPDHVVASAKALVVARPPACIYDETTFPSYAPVYRAMLEEDSASASASPSISAS